MSTSLERRTANRDMLMATIHCNAQARFGGALGGVSIAARQIVCPGAIAKALDVLPGA